MSHEDPAECYFCGDRATGLGIGLANSRDKDPKWLCLECSMLAEDIKRLKRPDAYKIKAREGGMEAAAPLVEEYGADLSQWEEEQVLMFCGAVWDGCAKRLREMVREGSAPF